MDLSDEQSEEEHGIEDITKKTLNKKCSSGRSERIGLLNNQLLKGMNSGKPTLKFFHSPYKSQ